MKRLLMASTLIGLQVAFPGPLCWLIRVCDGRPRVRPCARGRAYGDQADHLARRQTVSCGAVRLRGHFGNSVMTSWTTSRRSLDFEKKLLQTGTFGGR